MLKCSYVHIFLKYTVWVNAHIFIYTFIHLYIYTFNPADKTNSLLDDLKKTVEELQSDKRKSETKINNLEVMLKAFREEKIISDKRIMNLEKNQLNKQCKQIPQMESKGNLVSIKDNNLLKETPSEPREKKKF